MPDAPKHQQRKEIARYLLSRQAQPEPIVLPAAPSAAAVEGRGPAKRIQFPAPLAPTPKPLDPRPPSDAALPQADVVVVTWTGDEADALAHALTPGQGRDKWYPYDHRFAEDYAGQIRAGAPAAQARRLASWFPVTIGSQSVLCMKSELHMNQDGKSTGPGTATLPVKDFFTQIMKETKAKLVLTVGTAGSVRDDFELGDVVVTRAAKFRCDSEFKAEPFNGKTYASKWAVPTTHFDTALALMQDLAAELLEPPFGPPTKRYPFPDGLVKGPTNQPDIKLDGRDMPENHPILTTDYFEYGTSANRLDKEGAGVEMGDAALGLACSELDHPPWWAVVRNMSDPVINGDLPADEFHLNQQTTWAVAYYTAYGRYTSLTGAIATWAIIAGLDQT